MCWGDGACSSYVIQGKAWDTEGRTYQAKKKKSSADTQKNTREIRNPHILADWMAVLKLFQERFQKVSKQTINKEIAPGQ